MTKVLWRWISITAVVMTGFQLPQAQDAGSRTRFSIRLTEGCDPEGRAALNSTRYGSLRRRPSQCRFGRTLVSTDRQPCASPRLLKREMDR